MRNPRVLLYVAIVLAVLNLARKAEPQQTLPLVMADYQHCVTVRTGPIESRTPPLPYQRQKDVA